MAAEMEITDIVNDRLSVTLDKLEALRSGIEARMIAEAEVQLGYDPAQEFTDLQKLHIGLFAAVKLCRAALDLYQEDLNSEQADDVRRQYQERIAFLKEKISQLQKEFADIEARLIGDPDASPPCFDIKKATSDSDSE